jgi:putative NIF3 family GTP cyclohydrolase 1 type 2
MGIPFLLLLLLMTAAMSTHAADQPATTRPTARQIVERIKQNVHVPWAVATVDTFKAGDPDIEVTGIVTTHLATLEVLQRASAAGKNFVITHEPTFYNHLDQTKNLEGDKVLAEKQAFIEKHGMVVWRFHDHWHRRQPDGIYQGVVKQVGWEKYLRPGEQTMLDVPEISLDKMAAELKEKLHGTVVRVVGKPEMKFTKVGMVLGAAGSARQIAMLQREDIEVLLIGETPEWETVEYVRDAVAEGKAKALILLGHANSEEPGMENCAQWLKEFIPEVPIEFMAAGDPFWLPGGDFKNGK